MGENWISGHCGSVELPPYRALLVVDIKDFGGRPGRHHEELTRAVPDLLQAAFSRCGLAGLWDAVRFDGTTGDGFALGFEPRFLPFLVNPFLAGLQEELAFRHRVAPAGHDRPLRMRVSLNVGPMTDSGDNRLGDGSGAARVETHRLLDADPVRRLLDLSAPTATFVAAAVSARVFEDAVVAGFAGLDPSLFVEAPAHVKSYQGRAYLYVPVPSGGLLEHGFRYGADPGPGGGPDSAPARADAASGKPREYRRGGVGDIAGSVGTIVTDARGPVHTGDSFQLNHERER